MSDDSTLPAPPQPGPGPVKGAPPLVIATTLSETGITGAHTHFCQPLRFLEAKGTPASLMTSSSWGGPLLTPVFGTRVLLQPVSGSAKFRAFERDVSPQVHGMVYVSPSGRDALLECFPGAAAVPSAVVGNFVASSAPRTGGIPERFDDGVERRFWPLDDAAEAATMLFALVDDEVGRSRTGLAARDRFTRLRCRRRRADAALVHLRRRGAGRSERAPGCRHAPVILGRVSRWLSARRT